MLTMADVRSYLLGSTPIAAAVVDRVYYDGLAPPNPTVPYLLVRFVGASHTMGLAAIAGTRVVTVRIDAISTAANAAESLIEQVRNRIVAMHGQAMGSTTVQSAILDDSFYDVDPPVPGGRTTALVRFANVYQIGCAESQPNDHEE